MLSVSLCHAAADADFALELGLHLEQNTRATVEFIQGTDLLASAAAALSCDVAILVVSTASTRARWNRAEFEPVLIHGPKEHGTHLGTILLDESPFPKVLRLQNCFDGSDRRECRRAVRRWILSLDPVAGAVSFAPEAATGGEPNESLWAELVDAPGSGSASREEAIAFARLARPYFDGVLWVDCQGRTRTSIIGELGAQLGLTLRGEADDNYSRIRSLCEQYRCLAVFEGGGIDIGGRTSMLMVADYGPIAAPSLPDSTAGLHHALRESLAADWSAAYHLARSAIAFYKQRDRLAEAFEIIEWLTDAAFDRRDKPVLSECAWERSWILEAWGQPPGVTLCAPPVSDEQLSFGW